MRKRLFCLLLAAAFTLGLTPALALVPTPASTSVTVQYVIADLCDSYALNPPSSFVSYGVTDANGANPDADYALVVSYADSMGWLPKPIPSFKSTATAEFALNVSMAMKGYKNMYSASPEALVKARNAFYNKLIADYLKDGGISTLSQSLTPSAYDRIKSAHEQQKVPIAINQEGYNQYGDGDRDVAIYVFEMLTGITAADESHLLYKANAYNGLGLIYRSDIYMMYEKAKEYFEKSIATDPGGATGKIGAGAKSQLDSLPNLILSRTYEAENAVTYQEFVAMINHYRYHSATPSDKLSTDINDEKGSAPADYALAAVKLAAPGGREYYVDKPTSWSDPVPRWWAAEYLCRMNGNYNYTVANINPYEDTFGMTTDKRMYLTRAVEIGALLPVSAGSVNPYGTIKRGEVFQIAGRMKNMQDPETLAHPNGTEPKVHSYFTGSLGNDTDLAIFDRVKGKVDMITFLTTFLELPDKERLEKEGTKHLSTYYVEEGEHAKERLAALSKAQKNGIETYFGFSLYGGNDTFEDCKKYLASLIDDDQKLKELCNDLVIVCKKYGYTGVNLGLEFVDITLDQHTKLARAMSEAMHDADLKLIITIGAVFRDYNMLETFYDYQPLSQLGDYIHLLTYDDTSVGNYAKYGIPGSVSGYESIRRCLKYAMYSFPPEKLLMGFGTYAIDYTVGITSDGYFAENLTHEEVKQRLAGSSTTPVYGINEVTEGPYVEYTNQYGRKHIISYDDKESFQKRMQLAYDNGLAGVSYYWLGSEGSDFFTALDAVYNRSYATSVTGASSWAQDEITKGISAGLLPEYIQNNYKQSITRNEFFDLIRIAVEKLGIDVSYPGGVTFADSASPAAMWAVNSGVTSVALDKPFSPFRTITRQEAAVVMTNAASKVMGRNTSDAPQTSYNDQGQIAAWAANQVNYVSFIGVMNGKGTAGFVPLGTLSREEAFLIVYRFYETMK